MLAVVVVACSLGLTVKFKHQPLSIAPLLPVEFENTYKLQVPVAPAPLNACPMVLGPAGSPLPIGLGKRKPLCGAGGVNTPSSSLALV